MKKAVLTLIICGFFLWASSVTADDRGRPEQVLFFQFAVERIETFRKLNGRYPSSWAELNPEFACGSYHVGDTGLRPNSKESHRWRPKNCSLTYQIETVDGLKLTAFDNDGIRRYSSDENGNITGIEKGICSDPEYIEIATRTLREKANKENYDVGFLSSDRGSDCEFTFPLKQGGRPAVAEIAVSKKSKKPRWVPLR